MSTSTTPTRHGRAYLDYLDAVVRGCDAHLDVCRKAKGAPATVGLKDDLRWTGFVGDNYDTAPLRVLCAAQLHHGPMLAETGQEIQSVLRRIREDGATSAAADELARTYEDVVGGWGPWPKFEAILRAINPALAKPSLIAYVNIAKCWGYPQGYTIDERKVETPVAPPMRACQTWLPLEVLVSAIRADIVVMLSGDSTKESARIVASVPIFNERANLGRKNPAYPSLGRKIAASGIVCR